MAGESWDVAIVGGGNAALSAALAAREAGARVIVLERAPEDEAGGNSRFTAGVIRFAFSGLDELREIAPDLSDAEIATTEFGAYDEDAFFDDMFRVTRYRTNPDLTEILVRRSREAMGWLGAAGVRFEPLYGRQAFKVDGRFHFWGGVVLGISGGGPGLIDALSATAAARGVAIRYGARALSLLHDGHRVLGLRVKVGEAVEELRARAVVLASGGFEANAEWRARYLGPGWELAKVRGTRFNTGDGIRMALDIGASSAGNWSGCHAVGWELNSPEFGDLAVGDQFQKHSYPFSIMVNARGERFLDEGADFRNYTYAKYGREILAQPDQFCWQVFDKKVLHLLRDEYRIRQVTKVTADSLEELAGKLEGVDAAGFLETVRTYNAAVRTDVPFEPNRLDGRGTEGLSQPKTNWANSIDEPPFEAYATTCGITFTFGGLRIDKDARVLDTDHAPIPGLYAAGELVGGLFYFNYPGGTGLMSGTVFGRLAGTGAAAHATEK